MEYWRRSVILLTTILLGFILPHMTGQGYAQPAKSPHQALLIYRDAANFQNNNAFELAAEEWQRFLDRFPDDPLASKAQHYLGVCLLQLKQFERAAGVFQQVITKHPDIDTIEDAYLNLAWCQYTLAGDGAEGMYVRAAENFATLLKKFPDGKYADQATFFLGESQYHLGNLKSAAVHYARVVEAHPESALRVDALYALGGTYEELGQYPAAGRIYDVFLKEFGDNPLVPEIRLRKAETVLQMGQYAEAATVLGDLAVLPDFASADQALFRQAFCLVQLDQLGEAAALYAKLATGYPDSEYVSDAVLAAGRSFYRAEQFEEAAKWFQTAREAGGEFAPEAAHWLSRIALRDGDAARALDVAQQAMKTAADSEFLVHLKMDQADAYYELPEGRAKALPIYLAVATEHGEHELAPQALYNAAFAALELRQYKQAKDHVATFLQAFPEHRLVPDVRYVGAESDLQLGRHEQAESAYRSLIQEQADHPELADWTIRLASTLYLQRKYAEVLSALPPLIQRLDKPEVLAEAHYLIGASQYHSEQFPPSIASLSAALEAAPKWRQADETMLLLGRAQRADGQDGAARETIKKLIADFPNSRVLDQAYYRLGEYAYADDDLPTALGAYEAVLATWPESLFAPFAMYGKGWSHWKRRQYDQAIQSFSNLIADHPEHELIADALYGRAISRRQAGQFAESVQDLNAYLETEPELPNQSDALYERGLAEVASSQWSEAVSTLQQLLQANPEYAHRDKVMYEIAWAYRSMEDQTQQAEALPWFRRLTEETPDGPLAAEAWFHVGESQYDQQQYDQAAASYAAAKSGGAQGELAEKVLYKLGWSHFQQRDYEQALAEFTAQADAHPSGALAADAALMNAECLFRLADYRRALAAYEALQELELSSPQFSALALLHGGQSASQLKEWDKAVSFFESLLSRYDQSPYVPEARYELAFAQQNLGDEKSAMQNFTLAAESSRESLGARARFMIGELHFAGKDYRAAIREFQRVMFGFGGDAAADEIKPWQAKAAFEAARCSEVQIQDAAATERPGLIADARRFYQYVVEKHPEHELAAQAKSRLQVLSKL